jgi:hypothetical protein
MLGPSPCLKLAEAVTIIALPKRHNADQFIAGDHGEAACRLLLVHGGAATASFASASFRKTADPGGLWLERRASILGEPAPAVTALQHPSRVRAAQ